jgi:hypothetical protein
MARPKKDKYDARVEVRMTTAEKELFETLLRDGDDSLSAFLRRAGRAYAESILASRRPTGAAETPPTYNAGQPPEVRRRKKNAKKR